MNIYLTKMTKTLLRQFFMGFTNDPNIYSDMDRFSAYIYREADVDARWERQQQLGRIHLAVMLGEEPIGEILFKDIRNTEAAFSIHMKNDRVKNHGYGTRAEILAMDYAFHVLGLKTVFADAIHKNKRSQHVLQKAGFVRTHCDDRFVYYKCEKQTWKPSEAQEAEPTQPDSVPTWLF